jgi:hypothetical protein
MAAPGVRRYSSFRIQWAARNHSRSPHHVENASREAEKQKHDHSPGCDSQQAIEHPTEGRTDQNGGDEFGREAKTSGDRRRVGGWRLLRSAFGRMIGMTVSELLAQTLESRGKRSLVGRRLLAVTFLACVVGHALDTRAGLGKITTIPPPKPRGPY